MSSFQYHYNRPPWPWKMAAILAATAIALTSCGGGNKDGKVAAAQAVPAVSVVVAPVVQKTVPLLTELTARTDATQSVDIRARVKAFLAAQSYEEGTMVKAGQVLFTLDKREYEAQLMNARAQLAKAQADLAQAQERTVVDVAQANLNIALAQMNKADTDVRRLKPLAEKQAVPQQDYDNSLAAQQSAKADTEGRQAALNTSKVNQAAQIQQAQAAVQSATAGVNQAALNVEYCTVTSPITGIAGTRQVAPGNLVGQGEATLLTTVSNVNPMRVYVSISEREYLIYQALRAQGKMKGRAGELDLILADGSVFPDKGRIIIADRAVDLKTGTLSFVAEFPNPKALLRPGQFGRVRMAATVAENALLLPQKAVTQMQSAKVVYVVGSDNKVALRTVTIADRVGQDYIVTDGVKAGERVIVEGIQKARPGSIVSPTDQPASAETARREKRRVAMAKFFIHRPVFAIVISLIILIAGGMSIFTLPIAQYPQISPPTVEVEINYPGANSETVEQSIATNVEAEVNGAENMIYMSSKSSSDGRYVLTCTFKVGANLDMANVDINNRVNKATAKLPKEAVAAGISVKKKSPDILLAISVYSPDSTFDETFLSNFTSINLVDPIARTPGVGSTMIVGQRDYAMRFWVRPDKLAKLGLTGSDLANVINEQNLVAPAGQVGQPPAKSGTQFQYTVNVKGRLTEPAEFENMIVRTLADGSILRMKDVSRTELSGKSYTSFGRKDGIPATVLIIYQLPGANAIETVGNVKKLLDESAKSFPPGLQYRISLDTTKFVEVAIHEVFLALRDAIILVLIVVFIFLGNFRATFIPMLAVPVSLVGTFAAFVALGFSINTLTMLAVVLAVGIVVDDAIVVVEAVEHHIEHGLSPLQATEKAMDEVSGPVVAIGLVLCAVFVPVSFMGGIVGQLYRQFAITISISVILSVIVALTLTPALCQMLLRPRKEIRGPVGAFLRGFNKVFNKTTDGYLGGVGFFLRRAVIGARLPRRPLVRRGGAADVAADAVSFPTKTRVTSSRCSTFPTALRWSAPIT